MPNPKRPVIRTPDQRLRVFVSSTLQELAEERAAAREAITKLRLAPVMFELGARPHPPRDLYRAYLEQSHIFIGIYWQHYGWVAPGETISGLEDEYSLSGDKPKLIYVKSPARERESGLKELLDRVRNDDTASYKPFSTTTELRELIENDLAILLTERFETSQVTGAQLAVEAAESRRNNLPGQLTPFIGREREIAAVRDLLMRDDVRLVTLAGVGGTGKTRLALQVAADLSDVFEDGVFLVPLAPISDPHLVTSTIAQTLDVRERGGRPLLESLKEALQHKQMLLLLDNFEQVVTAAPVVADLLAAAPQLKVLVTSREPLQLRAEHEFPVPPLALPDLEQMPSLEQLSQVEAVRLFIERAKAVKPDFELTVETAPAVVEICHRLDGLPLAIELAAARIKLLPPQAMLLRLSSQLKFLRGGPRDLPVRQQTLRSTIDWSYSLLQEDEKTLFQRLSIFVGGCTLEAAEAVCNAEGDLELLEVIASLANKSLLHQEERAGQPRFGMLETIREYALEQLEAGGKAEAIHREYVHYFLRLAEEAEPYLNRPQQVEWFARLEEEHDNFRAALAWCRKQEEVEPGLRLAGALHWFWFMHGYLSEGRGWLEAILTADNRRQTIEGEPSSIVHHPSFEVRAKAVTGAGYLAWAQGDYPQAVALGQEALALSQAIGDERGTALARFVLGIASMMGGELGQARTLIETALVWPRKTGDQLFVLWGLTNLGLIAERQGEYERARALLEDGLVVAQEIGDKGSIAYAWLLLAILAQSEGDAERATPWVQDSLALLQQVGDRLLMVLGLNVLAWTMSKQGQTERAARLMGAGEALEKTLGAPLPLVYRADYDRYVTAVRVQLDEATFQSAWAEGRAMSLEQAIGYALEETSPDQHSILS